jgi:hypothetical protein
VGLSDRLLFAVAVFVILFLAVLFIGGAEVLSR